MSSLSSLLPLSPWWIGIYMPNTVSERYFSILSPSERTETLKQIRLVFSHAVCQWSPNFFYCTTQLVESFWAYPSNISVFILLSVYYICIIHAYIYMYIYFIYVLSFMQYSSSNTFFLCALPALESAAISCRISVEESK